MSSTKYRNVRFYKNYFYDFFKRQNAKVQEKIAWTLELVEDLEIVPKKYLKHVQGDLYEIRVQHGTDIFRIFCFFDQGRLIVIMNGFQKKSQRTPKREIETAKAIKREYEARKHRYQEP